MRDERLALVALGRTMGVDIVHVWEVGLESSPESQYQWRQLASSIHLLLFSQSDYFVNVK